MSEYTPVVKVETGPALSTSEGSTLSPFACAQGWLKIDRLVFDRVEDKRVVTDSEYRDTPEGIRSPSATDARPNLRRVKSAEGLGGP